MKKRISIIILLIAVVTLSTVTAYGNNDLYIWTKASILIEEETGKVLYEQDADVILPPASLSKMMTFLLAQEALEKGEITLKDRITVSKQAARTGSSTYRLTENEGVDFKELLEAMMIVSANGAAVAIGEHISGDLDDFIMLMNKKAKEIGMTNTTFINPHGLPVYREDETLSNTSTARDLSILARYLLQHYKKETLELSSKEIFESRFTDFRGQNTNPLLSTVSGVDGLKTGFAGEAGYCLAVTQLVESNSGHGEDMRLIGITLGAGNARDRIKESTRLLEYGSEKYVKSTIIHKDDYVTMGYLYNEEDLAIKILAKDSLIIVSEGEQEVKEQEVHVNKLKHPIKKGDVVGELTYTFKDGTVMKVDLISDTEIEKISIWKSLKLWWSSVFSE